MIKKLVSILLITAMLFCFAACSGDKYTASDLLIREGVYAVNKINDRANEAYLRAVGYSDPIAALAKDLSVKGDIKKAYLCTDGVSLLQSMTAYNAMLTDALDNNYLVSAIPTVLAGKTCTPEMMAAIGTVSASDVVSLDGKIDKPAILLLEYDDVCVFVSFIPAANGLTAVEANAVPKSTELFDLLHTDDTSVFTAFSAQDVANVLSSVDESVLNCDADKSKKDKEWFCNTALKSMKNARDATADAIKKYAPDAESAKALEDIQKHIKGEPISHDVFYLTDDRLSAHLSDSFGIKSEDITKTVLDSYATRLAQPYINASGMTFTASDALFSELCASSMYAARLTGAKKGTYYVVIRWQGGCATVTALRDAGRGGAVPYTHFMNDENAVNNFLAMLNRYGTAMN